MTPPETPRPARNRLIRTFIFLLLLFTLEFAPLWQCWNCDGAGRAWLMEKFDRGSGYELKPCVQCKGRGRIGLVAKMMRSRSRYGIPTPLERDLPAEDAFRVLGEKVVGARTLRLRFRTENDEDKTDGTLLLGAGNKLRLQFVTRCSCHAEPHEVLIVSDGKRAVEVRRYGSQAPERSEKATPSTLSADLAAGLFQAGVYSSHWTALEGRSPRQEHPVDALRASPGVLSYRIIDGSKPGSAQLFYNPSTMQPQRLELTRYGKRIVDHFDELALNVDVADADFVLP